MKFKIRLSEKQDSQNKQIYIDHPISVRYYIMAAL